MMVSSWHYFSGSTPRSWLRKAYSIAALIAMAGLIGCGHAPAETQTEIQVVRETSSSAQMSPNDVPSIPSDPIIKPAQGLIEANYSAADNLVEMIGEEVLVDDPIFLAASLVNIDNLTESSTLGRVISEQISSRFTQRGFKIFEAKLRRGAVSIKEKSSEFLLSREIQNLGVSLSSRYVIVGTYAVTKTNIFVSVRVIGTQDSVVVAGCDYELLIDRCIASLLE